MRRFIIKARRRIKWKITDRIFLITMICRICFDHGRTWGNQQWAMLERKLWTSARDEARRRRSALFRAYARDKRLHVELLEAELTPRE